jgi:hypothetical protein
MSISSTIWAVLAVAALIVFYRLIKGYGESRYEKGYRNSEADRQAAFRRLADKLYGQPGSDDSHFRVLRPGKWKGKADTPGPDIRLVKPEDGADEGRDSEGNPMPDGRG